MLWDQCARNPSIAPSNCAFCAAPEALEPTLAAACSSSPSSPASWLARLSRSLGDTLKVVMTMARFVSAAEGRSDLGLGAVVVGRSGVQKRADLREGALNLVCSALPLRESALKRTRRRTLPAGTNKRLNLPH